MRTLYPCPGQGGRGWGGRRGEGGWDRGGKRRLITEGALCGALHHLGETTEEAEKEEEEEEEKRGGEEEEEEEEKEEGAAVAEQAEVDLHWSTETPD